MHVAGEFYIDIKNPLFIVVLVLYVHVDTHLRIISCGIDTNSSSLQEALSH